MAFWAPYKPTDNAPWNIERIVHLHRRAAFAAPWEVIERDLRDGPETAVARLLEGRSQPEGAPDEFERLAQVIGQAAVDSSSAARLKAWWLYRCLLTPHPLHERMALIWHNHFATSNLKVDDLRLMKRQNETFRKYALSRFGDLLADMLRDPALLNWLDAPANRKQNPNENLARELMELFTLGIGHYREDDVKQVARALTGRTVRNGEYIDQPAAHDDGEKMVLGKTGPFAGDDVAGILLAQPATARRLAWRLTAEFCGEGAAGDEAIGELANELLSRQLDVGWAVGTILRSELFFSSANIGTRVCDPVSYAVGLLRALECWRDPPSTLVLAEWVAKMGQDLFYPPNVGGWPGGRAWLSTRTVIARTNFITALTAGNLSNPPRPRDFATLVGRHAKVGEPLDDVANGARFLSNLLFGRNEAAADVSGSTSLVTVLNTLLTSPRGQLH